MNINDLIVRALLGSYNVPNQYFRVRSLSLEGEFLSTRVYVGTVPTLLPAVALSGRRHVSLYNIAGETIYLGGATVTIDNGLPLPAGDPYAADASDEALLYAIAASASCETRVLEAS